ncbi:MAG: CPBP family intramembrane metalloprotease [Spirochaetes bacterium]|nr:CPBP family intramembrane metalloprotease [Spirochaetota bacterium]
MRNANTQANVPRGAVRINLRGRGFEFAAVVVTAVGFLIFGLSFIYIGAASLFWIAYVVFRYRWDSSVFVRWGFRRAGFMRAVKLSLPFTAVGFGFCLVYGVLSNGAVVNANLLLLLLLYPLWGSVQQFLVVALVGENMVAMSRGRISEGAAVLVAAVLFASIHAADYELVIATFFLGLVTTSVYFRTKNVWVPGIFHGWFATLFYYLVMGEDPWAELVLGGFRL